MRSAHATDVHEGRCTFSVSLHGEQGYPAVVEGLAVIARATRLRLSHMEIAIVYVGRGVRLHLSGQRSRLAAGECLGVRDDRAERSKQLWWWDAQQAGESGAVPAD